MIRFGNAGLTIVNTGETSANPFSIYHPNRESYETRSSHVRTSARKPVAMCSNKKKSSRDSIVVQESYTERRDIKKGFGKRSW